MGLIDDDDVLRVQRASDIVQVIQGFLGPLKRAGSNYKALCPFHDEKSPSFTVSPPKQMYYCFGCHAGGDVIRFVMTHEKLDFPDAVRLLADRAGITLREREGEKSSGLRRQLADVNAWAAGFFHDLLDGSAEGAGARDYVKKRGIQPDRVREFRLGYAPPAWDRLLTAARAKGFAPDLLEKAGLVIRRQEGPGHYDRFRNRLMFPIFDPRQQVIGFGARSLDGSEPKYLNSPETPLFSKGRALYGLNFAKEAAAENGRLAVVEGYTDVIMARQHGVGGVVATLGTALTRDHLGLLRRYADTVVLVYDGDEAGAKASERGADLLLAEEGEIRVARLPSGEDPCDTLVRAGAEAFRACLDASLELFEFILDAAQAGRDPRAGGDRARAADGVIARLNAVPNPVRLEMLVKRTAEAFGVTETAVRARLAALKNAGGVSPAAPGAGPAPAAAPVTPDERVGEKLLSVIFFAPHLLPMLRERVPLESFPGTTARAIASKVYGLAERGGAAAGAEVLALAHDDPAQVARLSAVLAEGDAEEDYTALFHRCLAWIGRKSILLRIGDAKARGDLGAVQKLFEEYDRLSDTEADGEGCAAPAAKHAGRG